MQACDTVIKVVPKGKYLIDEALVTDQGEGNEFAWGLSWFDMWKCWWHDFMCILTSRTTGILGSFTFSSKSIFSITLPHCTALSD